MSERITSETIIPIKRKDYRKVIREWVEEVIKGSLLFL